MDDLISRKALDVKLDALIDLLRKRALKEEGGWVAVQAGVTLAQGEVTDAPTIDTERHAHWIQHDAGPLKSECSACRTTFNTRIEYGLSTRYCPSCGARMDGGDQCETHR